jgi:hypothetical protein
MAVSLLKPPNGGFRIDGRYTAVLEAKRKKSNGYVFNGHPPTDASARSGVTAM